MKYEFSAGGIVYKPAESGIQILLCKHSQHHGWVFPKGLIGDHIEKEDKRSTALREVKEETGAAGKIIKPLSPVSYWYAWEKTKIKKIVYYYIMEYIDGDITRHDTEMEDVEWLPPEKVEKRLTYQADKKAWQEAEKILRRGRIVA